MKKLAISFYNRKDVNLVAKELLGKILVSQLNGKRTSGRIVETEAYVAIVDKASHSFGGRRTAKNEHMYSTPGTAYVYICYGMHQMMNVVTNDKDVPDAVLIRALDPIDGIDIMLTRTGKPQLDQTLTKGPGNVGKAMGIFKMHSGQLLTGNEIMIYDDGEEYHPSQIGTSSRIGVESAGPDGLLPYRYYVRGNKYVSGRPVK